MKKVKYNLHSVCVHEGSAALGHFWTYIWNETQQKWYKFNDTEVCESNWDDLYANAIGGVTSAYFLIYVNANDENLYKGYLSNPPYLVLAILIKKYFYHRF